MHLPRRPLGVERRVVTRVAEYRFGCFGVMQVPIPLLNAQRCAQVVAGRSALLEDILQRAGGADGVGADVPHFGLFIRLLFQQGGVVLSVLPL